MSRQPSGQLKAAGGITNINAACVKQEQEHSQVRPFRSKSELASNRINPVGVNALPCRRTLLDIGYRLCPDGKHKRN
eukprot:1163943-Amphidinium_carterae.2